ncbi:MAG: hypothetical protein EB069_11660, partial [Actinobacteria bacterium]|nr:hypothetical protein [Actinomycetota bacterium]
RWFLDPKNNPGVQKMVERVLQVNNMQRSDFPSGAFVNPRTGEILDRKVMEDVGVVISPSTGRPVMSAAKEVDTVLGDRKKGKITKSNLVRKQLYEPEGDQLLKDVDFIATIEQDGMHKYALGMEYANPAMMYNTMSGKNPTLRPKSQGDVFGIGDIVGRVLMKSSGMPHDVYESLFVAPKGSDPMRKPNPFAPLFRKGGPVSLAPGGSVAKAAAKVVKKALSADERKANLEKLLEPSVIKTPMYHGTSHDIVEFKTPKQQKNKSLEFSGTDQAVFFSPDPQFAERYPGFYLVNDKFTPYRDASAVYPVHVQVKNPFDYDNPEHVDALVNRLWQNLPKNPSGMQREKVQR